MTVESDRLDELAAAVSKASPDFDREQQRLALNLYRRLAEGSPAPAADVAERGEGDIERVEEVLRSWPSVYRDDRGRVVGFWGLTVNRLTPTHVFEIQGRELFTWCAWDTLFLPSILDATARVGSTCPTTGETISLVVSPERVVETSHPAAVVSFLTPHRDFDADVIESFCHFVHFFASSEAGRTWTTGHPGTFLLSLEDAFELGRRVNALNFPLELGSTG